MPYTYYHREQGRDIVVISEEKVPENIAELSGNIEAYFEGPFKNWLSRSKAYDVFTGEEEKFKQFIMEDLGLIESELPEYFELFRFAVIPNEVVRINNIQTKDCNGNPIQCTCEYKEYAFFNQPEEKKDTRTAPCPCTLIDTPCHPQCSCLNDISSFGCLNCCSYGGLEQRKQAAEYLNALRLLHNKPEEKKTEIVEMTDNYVRVRSNYVPEWALKLGDLHKELIAKLDSSVQPEEKDLMTELERAAKKAVDEYGKPQSTPHAIYAFGLKMFEAGVNWRKNLKRNY